MKKAYAYKNGIIYVVVPDGKNETIYKATERFLRQVIAENKGANSKWEQ